MRRSARLCGTVVALAASAGASPARGDLAPGDVRTAQARDGTPVREKPRPLSKLLATLAYGTRVKVQDVESFHVQVVTDAGATGWVRAADLVSPGALTGPGASGPQAVASSGDLTAAGRQFDQKTEKTYRKMNEALDAYYPLVDRIERDAPTEVEVESFVLEGRLGRTDEPGGGGTYARLRLQGVKGDGAVEVVAPVEAPLEHATPATDVEFVDRLAREFSPEQEYWLGRSVAAAAIAEHGLDPDAKRQALVRKIGAAIVRLSDRLRGTYGGYHFAVLDAAAPNGISGPGGFVFVTRGALALARSEDEVAAVLAHELAHVALKHGEAMVRATAEFRRQMDELKAKAAKPAERAGDCNVCGEVARLLGESSERFVKAIDVEGYGKEHELAADWEGSLLLCEVGYRTTALAEYLEVLPERDGARWTTHPSSEERIEALRPIVFRHGCAIDADAGAQARLARWKPFAAARAPAAPAKK